VVSTFAAIMHHQLNTNVKWLPLFATSEWKETLQIFSPIKSFFHTKSNSTCQFVKLTNYLKVMSAMNPDHLSQELGDSRVWHVRTCVQAIMSQARIYPSATALRGPKSTIDGTFRELSYTDLIRNAHTLMKRMTSFFVNGKTDGLKGKVIAILLPRDVDYVGKNQYTSIRFYNALKGMQRTVVVSMTEPVHICSLFLCSCSSISFNDGVFLLWSHICSSL